MTRTDKIRALWFFIFNSFCCAFILYQEFYFIFVGYLDPYYVEIILRACTVSTSSLLCLFLLPGQNPITRKMILNISLITIPIAIIVTAWVYPNNYFETIYQNIVAALVADGLVFLLGDGIQISANKASRRHRISLFLIGFIMMTVFQLMVIGLYWEIS